MTELVFILDRSGSMSGLEKDTIGGFNSMLEKQRKEPGNAVVSTVLFDNLTEVIHDRVPGRSIILEMSISMPGERMCRRRRSLSSLRMAWKMQVGFTATIRSAV